VNPLLTCQEVIDFLHDYVAGQQPSVVRAEFERHLKACRACREYLQTYRQTIAATRGALAVEAPAEPPEDLVQAIMAARRRSRSRD
jgi:anti-sigma factor RsiW